MVLSYPKGSTVKLSDDLNSDNFDCHCTSDQCDHTLVDERLIEGLDKLAITFPILTITSGFRCKEHNLKVGGSENSQHLLGKAADIHTPFGGGKEIRIAAELIDCFNNGGIGVAKDWAHLDVRGKKARWTYPIIKAPLT